MDGERALLTIGQLARRTGMAVRTIRYWSDVGVVSVAGRTQGGYRLYDSEAVARLELVATLRQLGLGLAEVRRVLEDSTTIGEVAAAHAPTAELHGSLAGVSLQGLATVDSPPAELRPSGC
jgi:DNA-binding transcriptional MerR regulator